MSNPDDTKDLMKAMSEGASEGAVRAALEPFVPPIAETGQTITDLIRYQRWKVQHWIARRARAYLDKHGIEASPVSLKILVPLLDAASLEDENDEDMQARWAALLANAAAGKAGAPVSPAFTRILADITPPEAALLDLIASREHGRVDLWGLQVEVHPESRAAESGVVGDSPAFNVHLENLVRLGLLEVERPSREVSQLKRDLSAQQREVERQQRELARRQSSPRLPRVVASTGIRFSSGTGSPMVVLTAWGRAFLDACSPPTGAQPGAQEPEPA